MDSFKDAYQEDLDNAFFDEDEFAEKHVLDGEECLVIITDVNAVLPHDRGKAALNPKEAAVNKVSYILLVRDRDLKRKVTSGAMITLDGKKYFVQDVKHQKGVYRLEIGIHAV